MTNRIELQKIFENILGSRNVYYQPPSSIKMKYPAIVYSRKNVATSFADDEIYIKDILYEVILIDKNPDSEYVDALIELPKCSYSRHYTADNLNHDVFLIYY